MRFNTLEMLLRQFGSVKLCPKVCQCRRQNLYIIMEPKWRTYEKVAACLLDRFSEDFGLNCTEGKTTQEGERSSTDWELDVKGYREQDEGFIIVECRRKARKISQEEMAAVAYRILDTGAEGGIIVTSLGLQKGARKVANAEGIKEVILTANSTPKEYLMKFLDKVMLGRHSTLTMSYEFKMTAHRVGDTSENT